ncbi:MAG: Rrf2 family transcriptional regulator, partial [Alphaproteobacteria bacterium]|nr:Rrf2 family transcriptional regulator [Alphaproteobacteria bacterium]
MRLTNFSDLALRMLMYAASAGDRLITIEETARTFKVSKTHLNKVANTLTRGGYLRAVRGRCGGLRALNPAAARLAPPARSRTAPPPGRCRPAHTRRSRTPHRRSRRHGPRRRRAARAG